MVAVIWILVTVLIVVLYAFFRHRFQYWAKKNVPGPEPTFILGNIAEIFTKKWTLNDVLRRIYEDRKREPYVGFYMMHRPVLMVNDLELAKAIMIKDFNHFMDHGFEFNQETQPLVNHLFNVTGQRWKSLRNKLTPAFTSNKMKNMFNIMADCGQLMSEYLKNEAKIDEEVDMKEIIAKYSTDNIVSCAFGIESNCFKDPNSEFRVQGKTVFAFSIQTNLALLLALFFPGLAKKLDIRVLKRSLEEFFINTVANTVKYREENNITRNDIMQMLIRLKDNESIDDSENAKNSSDPDTPLTPMEMTAQALGFFVGGFETTSSASSLIIYELCKNPDVQTKAREEIRRVLENHGGKITYDAIMDLTYLQKVIDETLRLHPVVPQMFRICTKDYVIPDTTVVIEKGTLVMIPNECFQKDPDIFPEPEIFNPENFSNESKASRHHFAFIPFGEGPRICIGMRFALIVVKIALVTILKDFEMTMGGDGQLHITPNTFSLTPDDMLVKLKRCS